MHSTCHLSIMEEQSDNESYESSESVIYLGRLDEVSSSEESEFHLPWNTCDRYGARSLCSSTTKDSSEASMFSLSWSSECSVISSTSLNHSKVGLMPTQNWRHSTPVCNWIEPLSLASPCTTILNENLSESLPLQGELS